MVKWLLICGFLVNISAFYWLSTQAVRNHEKNPSSEELPLGVVLLSELKVIPPQRPLSTVGAIAEAVVPISGAFVEVVKEEAAIGGALKDSGSRFLQDGSNELEIGADERSSGGVVASKGKSEIKQDLLTPRLEPEAGLLCVLLGRFDAKRDAAGLLEKLEREVGVTAKLQMMTEGLERYLVYMPPFVTQIKAKEQQSILKKNGIRSSLYYKGLLENGLSLGFFASKDNATRKYKSLLGKGYDVEIKTVVNKISGYWLKIEKHEMAKLSELFWQDLSKKFPGVLGKPAECVAPSELGR